MKVYNIEFTGYQQFKASQLLVADSEEQAREGINALLKDKIHDFAIEKIEDVTTPVKEAPVDITVN
jgi:hypothetical protein